MKKTILIIGSSGFIGKNLKEFLEKKENDYFLYSPSSKDIDVTDELVVKKYLKMNKFDVVIHCAVHNTVTSQNRDENKILENNLKMFYNFEKNCHLFGKMLYFGSGAEFNKRYEIRRVKEQEFEENQIPSDEYGLAKYIIAKSIENSKNIYNLRLFGVYGKYEHWKSKFISNCCCKAVKNIPISIRQNVFFEYLWIQDLCKIVEWFINNEPQKHSYNIGNGEPVDLISLAEQIVKVSNKNIPIYICKDGLANEYTLNNSRIRNEIKDLHFTKLEDAISELYSWYEENENIIDLTSLFYN